MSADQAMETEVAPSETLVAFASQGTKTQRSSAAGSLISQRSPTTDHPFDSQAELDQEVEDEKISHINRGFDVSGYSTSQWQEWVKGKKLRNLGGSRGSPHRPPSSQAFGLKFRQAHRSPIFQQSVQFQCLSHREQRCDRHRRKRGSELV